LQLGRGQKRPFEDLCTQQETSVVAAADFSGSRAQLFAQSRGVGVEACSAVDPIVGSRGTSASNRSLGESAATGWAAQNAGSRVRQEPEDAAVASAPALDPPEAKETFCGALPPWLGSGQDGPSTPLKRLRRSMTNLRRAQLMRSAAPPRLPLPNVGPHLARETSLASSSAPGLRAEVPPAPSSDLQQDVPSLDAAARSPPKDADTEQRATAEQSAAAEVEQTARKSEEAFDGQSGGRAVEAKPPHPASPTGAEPREAGSLDPEVEQPAHKSYRAFDGLSGGRSVEPKPPHAASSTDAEPRVASSPDPRSSGARPEDGNPCVSASAHASACLEPLADLECARQSTNHHSRSQTDPALGDGQAGAGFSQQSESQTGSLGQGDSQGHGLDSTQAFFDTLKTSVRQSPPLTPRASDAYGATAASDALDSLGGHRAQPVAEASRGIGSFAGDGPRACAEDDQRIFALSRCDHDSDHEHEDSSPCGFEQALLDEGSPPAGQGSNQSEQPTDFSPPLGQASPPVVQGSDQAEQQTHEQALVDEDSSPGGQGSSQAEQPTDGSPPPGQSSPPVVLGSDLAEQPTDEQAILEEDCSLPGQGGNQSEQQTDGSPLHGQGSPPGVQGSDQAEQPTDGQALLDEDSPPGGQVSSQAELPTDGRADQDLGQSHDEAPNLGDQAEAEQADVELDVYWLWSQSVPAGADSQGEHALEAPERDSVSSAVVLGNPSQILESADDKNHVAEGLVAESTLSDEALQRRRVAVGSDSKQDTFDGSIAPALGGLLGPGSQGGASNAAAASQSQRPDGFGAPRETWTLGEEGLGSASASDAPAAQPSTGQPPDDVDIGGPASAEHGAAAGPPAPAVDRRFDVEYSARTAEGSVGLSMTGTAAELHHADAKCSEDHSLPTQTKPVVLSTCEEQAAHTSGRVCESDRVAHALAALGSQTKISNARGFAEGSEPAGLGIHAMRTCAPKLDSWWLWRDILGNDLLALR